MDSVFILFKALVGLIPSGNNQASSHRSQSPSSSPDSEFQSCTPSTTPMVTLGEVQKTDRVPYRSPVPVDGVVIFWRRYHRTPDRTGFFWRRAHRKPDRTGFFFGGKKTGQTGPGDHGHPVVLPVESSMSATPSLQSSCLDECVFVGLSDRVQHFLFCDFCMLVIY